MPIGIPEDECEQQKIPQPSWLVAVRYTDGPYDDVVPLKNVIEFHPKHKTDYEYKTKYEIRSNSTRWYQDGKWRRYKVYIGRIAENQEKLDESCRNARLKYPPCEARSSDELGTESETGHPTQPSKESNAAVNKKKRDAAEKTLEELSSFVANNLLKSKSNGSAQASDRLPFSKKRKSTPSSPLCSNISSSDVLVGGSCSKSNSSSASRQSASLNKSKSKSNQQNPVTSKLNHAVHVSKAVPSCSKSQSLFSRGRASPNVEHNVLESPPSRGMQVLNIEDVNTNGVGIQKSFDSAYNSIVSENLAEKTELLAQVGPDGRLEIIDDSVLVNEDDKEIERLKKEAEFEKIKKELEFYKNLQSTSGLAKALQDIRDELRTLDCKFERRLDSLETSVQNLAPKQQAASGSSCLSTPQAALSWGSSGVDSAGVTGVHSSCGKPQLTADGRVPLGEGITITRSAYNTLTTTHDERQWCRAMLLGVFEEEAAAYRYIVQKKNKGKLKPFPHAYNSIVVDMYRNFLIRQGALGPFSKKDLEGVLSKISKKARDLGGRRNTGTGTPRGPRNSTTKITLDEAETESRYIQKNIYSAFREWE